MHKTQNFAFVFAIVLPAICNYFSKLHRRTESDKNIEKVQKVLHTDFTVEEVLRFLMLKKLSRMVEKPNFT